MSIRKRWMALLVWVVRKSGLGAVISATARVEIAQEKVEALAAELVGLREKLQRAESVEVVKFEGAGKIVESERAVDRSISSPEWTFESHADSIRAGNGALYTMAYGRVIGQQ